MDNFSNLVCSAIKNLKRSLTFPTPLSNEHVAAILRGVIMDHPEFFWYKNVYHYDAAIGLLTLSYCCRREKIVSMRVSLQEKLTSPLLSVIQRRKSFSDIQRIVAVFKYVTEQWGEVVAITNDDITHLSLYDIVFRHKGGQMGVARISQLLLKQQKLEVYWAKGTLRGNGDCHYWLVVLIDGQAFHFNAIQLRSFQAVHSQVHSADPTSVGELSRFLLCCVGDATIERFYENVTTNYSGRCAYDYSRANLALVLQSLELLEDEPCHDNSFSCALPCMEEDGVSFKMSAPRQFKVSSWLSRFSKQLSAVTCSLETDDFFVEDKLPTDITYEARIPHVETSSDWELEGDECSEPLKFSESISSSGCPIESLHSHLQTVYTSIYAPKEVKPGCHFLIDYFFHTSAETSAVRTKATQSQRDAVCRYYDPLDLQLQRGDIITVDSSLYHGNNMLKQERANLEWKEHQSRYTFQYYLDATQCATGNLYVNTHLSVNGARVGEISFLIDIVDIPKPLHSSVNVKKYNKVFISYSVKDLPLVKPLAFAYKQQGILHFFDKETLNAGDLYREQIFHHIDTADLFVLCWTQNAALSEHVAIERRRAMGHAVPQLPPDEATLTICPVSMQPYAPLPDDMKDIYHFENI